ncbi:signal transduction histidine kinase [Nocardioides zeae]|uniref:Signal transduction histidine kinase n=1 Tax=Nocardioides zeae TaxID=1457234 RepID=A0ACC6IM39_9ACTN|nr:ATP-binding protein [Nocardioides zeae]MDR6175969.1 signal transduction histidine kinase [Nocardioides zeae]MDR6211734.1 signal transduction histidine kinase [Nocardioides zeae]
MAPTTPAPAPATPARRGRAGVRVRTTVAATVVVAIAFALGGLLLALALGRSLSDQAASTAEQRAEEIAAQVERSGPGVLDPGADDPEPTDDDEDDDVEDVTWQVTTGDSLVASSGTGGRSLPRSEGTTRLDGDRYTVAVEDVEHEGTRYDVAVAVSLDDASDSVTALVPLLAVGLPVAVLLVGATTWVVTGRALRPVEAIRAQVASIGGDDLAARVPVPPSRDEVARLATTMNGMLERLEHSAEQQRRFVSDTSHELRSPLAGLRQTAEVARSHPAAIDQAELTEAVLEETARMQHLVEQMLVLTRTAEGGGGRRQGDVDLDDLLLAEATRLRRLRPDLAVDSSRVVPARAHGDGPALAQVVRNLADNAARHAAGTVRLSLEDGASGHVDVVVEDDGSGVPADDRERVFERFVRLDEARARDDGGSGLGLAIVREVARAHGGDARVEAGDLGGARFVVRLPAVADASRRAS